MRVLCAAMRTAQGMSCPQEVPARSRTKKQIPGKVEGTQSESTVLHGTGGTRVPGTGYPYTAEDRGLGLFVLMITM